MEGVQYDPKLWSAALNSIVGFVSFGNVYYAYLSTIPIRRAMLLTVAFGSVVSFTVEILQANLPTRDSATSDLTTNKLGAWIGAASYLFVTPILSRALPQVSAHAE